MILDGCNADSAAGTVANHSSERVDIFIRVTFLSAAGTQVSDSIDNVSGLAAGGTARWSAPNIGPAGFDHCEARVSSVFPAR